MEEIVIVLSPTNRVVLEPAITARIWAEVATGRYASPRAFFDDAFALLFEGSVTTSTTLTQNTNEGSADCR